EILAKPVEATRDLRRHLARDVEGDASRPDQSAPVPVAADRHEKIQTLATQAGEICRRRMKGHVALQRSPTTEMIGQPLELQRDATNRLRSWSLPASGERLDRAAGRARVADHRIAGDRLRNQRRALPIRRLEQSLDAAMLIAEHDLQRKHLFTVRLKAEVTRLDDPRVHGPDRYLVHFFSGHLVERVCLAVSGPGAPSHGRVVRRVAPQRLERYRALW